MSCLMFDDEAVAGLETEELKSVTTSILGVQINTQNSTTGNYYAIVDMSADIPDGYEIVSVGTIGAFDALLFIPNGRRFLVCSPRTFTVQSAYGRDVRVWYKRVS